MTPRSHALLLAGALTLVACDADDWGPAELLEGKSSQAAKVLRRGRLSYATYCAGCHGEKGDGNGPAARFLNPKPRDFRVGRLKFATVPAGSAPRDDDYMKVLRYGLHGTAMPAWELLPLDEQRAIVTYIRMFYPDAAKDPPAAMLALPADPWYSANGQDQKAIAEGERLYHGFAACYSCHPAYVTKPKIVEYAASYKQQVTGFRDTLYDAEAKDSDWGAPIKPPDFLFDEVKFARTREDLAQVIGTGVGGTAMPSWGTGLTPEQLWGLAYYVDSLIVQRATPMAAAHRRALLTQPPYQPPPSPPDPPAEAPAGGTAPGTQKP
jgi:mono/diheme cytochrome c family protein